MDANNIKIVLNNTNNKEINIPIEINWDFTGQDQLIELYEDDVVKDVVGEGYDFEVERFPHDIDDTGKSAINYEFYFYSGGPLNSINSWNLNYLSEGLTTRNLYYFENDFTKSSL